jgi:hypothetical protein
VVEAMERLAVPLPVALTWGKVKVFLALTAWICNAGGFTEILNPPPPPPPPPLPVTAKVTGMGTGGAPLAAVNRTVPLYVPAAREPALAVTTMSQGVAVEVCETCSQALPGATVAVKASVLPSVEKMLARPCNAEGVESVNEVAPGSSAEIPGTIVTILSVAGLQVAPERQFTVTKPR